jgi:hypothetical protein
MMMVPCIKLNHTLFIYDVIPGAFAATVLECLFPLNYINNNNIIYSNILIIFYINSILAVIYLNKQVSETD